MKRRKIHIIAFAVMAVAILFTLHIAIRNSKERIKSEADYAFKEAIAKDYNERLAYLGYYQPKSINWDIRKYALAPTLNRKIKEYTVRTRKGKSIYIFKDSLQEEAARNLLNQYILSQLKPIKVNELNATFRTILSDHGITGKCGTIYYNKQTAQYSNSDSILPPSAYHTPRYQLDITRSIRVQAWVSYDWKTILKHIDSTPFWIVAQFIFLALLQLYYKKKKNASVLSHRMVIDLEKQELVIDGTTCSIQKLDLTLLNIFHEKASTCINREEIKQIFWPTDDNANEKIDAHIKAIRKVLKDFPGYELITVRGKGYYLSIN